MKTSQNGNSSCNSQSNPNDSQISTHLTSIHKQDTKTKIICTIGPSSNNIIEPMILAGMKIARLNFSHGTHESHLSTINAIKDARNSLGTFTAIALDTKGPEMRLKTRDRRDVFVQNGQIVTLSNTLEHSDFQFDLKNYEKINPKQFILFDDGQIKFEVIENTNGLIKMKALNSHTVKNNKAVNIPGINIDESTPTTKDQSDILFGIEQKIDILFLSFVNSAAEVKSCRKLLENVENPPLLISKIESQLAVQNLDEIIGESDGIMIARGDLSVEIGYENLFFQQKRISRLCKKMNKPFIMATQMLESMCENSTPYRSEISDIGNAVLDGCDCTMLSGETASGKNPLRCIEVMRNIILNSEKTADELLSIPKTAERTDLIFLDDESEENWFKENNSCRSVSHVLKIIKNLKSFLRTREKFPNSLIHVFTTEKSLAYRLQLFSNTAVYLSKSQAEAESNAQELYNYFEKERN